MIRLHHLNQSRSIRILWLLEELGVSYDVVAYQRDAKTGLAPEHLKNVHPLGRSPVIEMDGKIYAESGAITELLIERFAPTRLRPDKDSDHYGHYLQWIHFAESSLMTPLLLNEFAQKSGACDNEVLANNVANNFARNIAQEQQKLLSYLDKVLEGKTYIIDHKLSGADFMLAFDLIMLAKNQQLSNYPNIEQYAMQLAHTDSYQRAMRLEANYDKTNPA